MREMKRTLRRVRHKAGVCQLVQGNMRRRSLTIKYNRVHLASSCQAKSATMSYSKNWAVNTQQHSCHGPFPVNRHLITKQHRQSKTNPTYLYKNSNQLSAKIRKIIEHGIFRKIVYSLRQQANQKMPIKEIKVNVVGLTVYRIAVDLFTGWKPNKQQWWLLSSCFHTPFPSTFFRK